jgi:hypothetical protein
MTIQVQPDSRNIFFTNTKHDEILARLHLFNRYFRTEENALISSLKKIQSTQNISIGIHVCWSITITPPYTYTHGITHDTYSQSLLHVSVQSDHLSASQF